MRGAQCAHLLRAEESVFFFYEARHDARGAHKHPAAPADVDDLVLREKPFVAIRHLPWVDVDERLDNNSESSIMIRCFFCSNTISLSTRARALHAHTCAKALMRPLTPARVRPPHAHSPERERERARAHARERKRERERERERESERKREREKEREREREERERECVCV